MRTVSISLSVSDFKGSKALLSLIFPRASAAAILVRQILWWDWTDERGDPLPVPGDDPAEFEHALWYLGEDERNYLRLHCWDSSRLGEA